MAALTANPYSGELGSTGKGRVRQLWPPSVLRCRLPLEPMALSPQAAKITWGSSGLTAIQRQYGAGKCWAMCSRCQLSPTSVLTKISRGVLVSTRVGWPGAMTMPWMSGSASPLHAFPSVASVQAAMHPVNLDPGPYDACIVGVDHGRGDPWCADGTLFRQIQGQLLPVVAPILGPVHGRRARAGEDGLRVGGGYGQGPDIQAVLWRTDPLPAGAVVAAAIQAAIGPSKEVWASVGCSASARTRLSKGKGWRILCQVSPPIRAVPQALPDRADANSIVLCHDTLLLPCVSIQLPQGAMIVCERGNGSKDCPSPVSTYGSWTGRPVQSAHRL